MNQFITQGQIHILFYFKHSATFGKELLLTITDEYQIQGEIRQVSFSTSLEGHWEAELIILVLSMICLKDQWKQLNGAK